MEKINKLVSEYIDYYEIDNFKEFLFPYNLSMVIIKNKKDFKFTKYKNKVPLKKSLKYSREFFESLSPEYAQQFDKFKDTVIFEKRSDLEEIAYSDMLENGEVEIFIPYNNTIKDAFSITHEITHATTLDRDLSLTRNIFCEVMALSAEILQSQFFEKKGLKDLRVHEQIELESVWQINIINIFQMHLINEFLENGYISAINFMKLLEDFDIDDVYTISNHIMKNLREDDFDVLFLNRYIIGYTLASYFCDRIKNNSEFVDLNDSMNIYSITDFLDYLELEYLDDKYLNLTTKSYQEIEKSYVKRIKSL